MPRKSKVITFSMPPEMADQVQQVVEEEGPLHERVPPRGHPPCTWTSGSGCGGSAASGPRPAGTNQQ